MFIGSLRKMGISVYVRQGQTIVRSAHSHEKRSNTLPQFVQRQKMRHAVALWKMLRFGCETIMFTQRKTNYQNFTSLANRLPVVFVPDGVMGQASFLMPGIPVSDGTLQTIKQRLGEIDGVPALQTDLKKGSRASHEKLLLYDAIQTIDDDMPRVRFSVHEVSWNEMTVVDGHYALVGDEFADEMKGWALVRVINDRCSPQSIVTRCTYYERFTTEEALQKATNSLRDLTDNHFLSPR